MDNDHLVNTIAFMHRRVEEVHTQGKRLNAISHVRVSNMKKEAKKRRLMPTVYRKIGDVRGMVAATHELHSKPDFVKRALQEKSNADPHIKVAEGYPRIRR